MLNRNAARSCHDLDPPPCPDPMNLSSLDPATARWLADAVVWVHLAFIVWVVAGGLMVLVRSWLAVLHLPAALWGVWIEWSGGLCPLTPLENALRRQAGEGGYDGGFVEHYLIPLIYPEGLTREWQWVLGAGVLVVNVAVYTMVWTRSRRRAAVG
jgi:hypothetical protein